MKRRIIISSVLSLMYSSSNIYSVIPPCPPPSPIVTDATADSSNNVQNNINSDIDDAYSNFQNDDGVTTVENGPLSTSFEVDLVGADPITTTYEKNQEYAEAFAILAEIGLGEEEEAVTENEEETTGNEEESTDNEEPVSDNDNESAPNQDKVASAESQTTNATENSSNEAKPVPNSPNGNETAEAEQPWYKNYSGFSK